MVLHGKLILLSALSQTELLNPVTFTAPDLKSLNSVARELANEIHPPLLVLVQGNLGAGKTTLIAEMLRTWGVPGAASPTFNLRNDYSADGFRILHLDFYRLRPGEKAFDLLPPDEDYSDAVVFAEWPEKAGAEVFQPFARRAVLTISVAPDATRLIGWQVA